MPATFLHGAEVLELTSGSRTITVLSSSMIGMGGTAPYADPAVFPLDTPVLVTTNAQVAALTANKPANATADQLGTLPRAMQGIYDQAKTPVVISRAEVGEDDATTQVNVIGDQAEGTGLWALLKAQAILGVKPKILLAPGFTDAQPTGGGINPVVAALKTIAPKLRAISVIDGPNDTAVEATTLAPLIGDQRTYMVDPFVKATNPLGVTASEPASARVAGVIALNDQANGYWWSPSNQVIAGVLGTDRPIDFGLSDPDAESNILNAAGVATVVQMNGYRLWGNRSTSATDPDWAFISVRRTADVIYDAIEAGFLWAMDRPFSQQLLEDVAEGVNEFLRGLKGGAIIDGKCWIDPDLNTPATLKAGQWFYDFDFEPPAPMERLTFQASRNGDYYTEVVTAASTVISQITTPAS